MPFPVGGKGVSMIPTTKGFLGSGTRESYLASCLSHLEGVLINEVKECLRYSAWLNT